MSRVRVNKDQTSKRAAIYSSTIDLIGIDAHKLKLAGTIFLP